MFRQHEMIPSESMGRHVHLWRYGHFGLPLLVFPSAAGMAHEWEAHGMIDTLADLIEAGKLKLYCTESNVAEAWPRKDNPIEWRLKRHHAYERYVTNELASFIRADCRTPDIPIAVTGTSLGALYSANFALKYPQTFRYALCMSGRYDASFLTDGFANEDVYFNSPVAYVPNMSGAYLDLVRKHTHLALVCGQGKWENGNIQDTSRLADALEAKGISHERDLWGTDVSHEWPWWRRQARYHLERFLQRAAQR
jgi:esterase/lipase superfamily enzyme